MNRRVLVPRNVPPSLLLHGPAGDEQVHALSGESMGTTWTAKFVAPGDVPLEAIRVGIETQFQIVIRQMSTWEPESDLSRFNRAAPKTWQSLPMEFFFVLESALAVASDTGGAYDPTAGPLVNLWGFGPDYPRTSPPPERMIAEARTRIGWDRVELDTANRRALQPGGIYIDLSAIAKGFAADLIAAYFDRNGFVSYLIETGGELRGSGMKPDGSPWWVGIEQPPGVVDSPETVVALYGLSVATSGNYRRYFESGGERYSHTIDPRTGHPVKHEVVSVTVLHESCMMADALSTALTVLGPLEGFLFASRKELAALFVEPGRELATEQLNAMQD